MLHTDLTAAEVLTTTRSVRKRLDLARPVEREVLEACLAIAQQAPTAADTEHWQFVVVADRTAREALAALYKRSWDEYVVSPGHRALFENPDPVHLATLRRVLASGSYLAEHMHEVPVLVVPCIRPRAEAASVLSQAGIWGSILPAAWSFMLAARLHGLGSTWTTLHLSYEAEAAELLGIPFDEVMQTALIPVAYTKGSDFKPGPRKPLDTFVRWDRWDA